MSHRACSFIPISMSGAEPRQEAHVKSLGVPKTRCMPLFQSPSSFVPGRCCRGTQPLPSRAFLSFWNVLSEIYHQWEQRIFLHFLTANDFLLELRSHSEQGSFPLGLLICWRLWTSAVTGPSRLAIPLRHSVGLPAQILLASAAFAYTDTSLDFMAFHYLWGLL